MNASGWQTAPPQFEVVSVTSALRPSLEALSRVKDLICAAAGCLDSGSQPWAGLLVQFAHDIADTASRFPILSALAVSGA